MFLAMPALARDQISSVGSSTVYPFTTVAAEYFGKNTALSKELQLYNALIKERLNSEASALDFIRSCKETHNKLNKSLLK